MSERLVDLAAAFLEEGRTLRNWTPATVRSYRQALARLTTFVGTLDVSPEELLDQPTLRAWVGWLRERRMAAAGANAYIRSVNSFATWLHENGHTSTHLRLRQLRCTRKVVRILTEPQLLALLKPRPRDYTEWRTRALIWLLIDTGVRIREALHIELDAIDFDGQLARVLGKGRRERVVPFGDGCARALRAFIAVRTREGIAGPILLATRSGTACDYQNVLGFLQAACERAKLADVHVTPHMFRHTYASRFVANGGNSFLLQRILGHACLSTTLRYVQLQTSDLVRAHRQFGAFAEPGRAQV